MLLLIFTLISTGEEIGASANPCEHNEKKMNKADKINDGLRQPLDSRQEA